MSKDDSIGGKNTPPGAYPRDIQLLLTEIEKEPVPERILALAMELQAALVEHRQREAARRR
ncbi:hypothetical protein [Chelativorans salis]|uniref:Uncharacterized protein n=1 Tax=Chelativorans salis TaxID=2978478 RepID=A0ABT2LSB6_9HYPH|nr:hypothetical protein [Chelativorans sp. EGI FJ00035]MCT7377426.1 hypothetical protein [Chelativorans sp. EGI FJ00035]